MSTSTQSSQKIIFITGGSSGIGAATARLALKAGHQVVVTGRSEEKLNALEKEFGGENFLAVKQDITSWADHEQILEQTLHKFGRIDVVFANAGLSNSIQSFKAEPNPEAWKEMILTNVYGVALTIQATLPELIKTKGKILITGSVVGRVAIPGSLYSATKWAITGMAESLRKEVIKDGVGVTLLEPGVVDTDFWPNSNNGGRPALSAEDVAQSAMFIINQPAHATISELIIRPMGQDI